MFPVVSDFTFVVCGMASFAATVGYVCSKRITSGNSNSHPSDGVVIDSIAIDSGNEIKRECDTVELHQTAEQQSKSPLRPDPVQVNETQRSSLKRKSLHDEDLNDLGYPYNLAAIYPNKRSRTPTRGKETEIPRRSPTPFMPQSEGESKVQNVSVEGTEQSREEINAASPQVVTAAEEINEASPQVVTAVESSPSPNAENSESVPDLPSTSSAKTTQVKEEEVSITEKRPSRPQPPPPPTVHKKPEMSFTEPSSGGFASFAATPGSGFNSLAGSPSHRPAWVSSKEKEVTARLRDISAPAPLEPDDTKTKPQHPTPKHTHITGEENEIILSEARGVKLFVKRGSKEFSDPILGHVKLLSSGDRKRLVFRREPLWQVTMNTWLASPAVPVRCTRDEENVLRVVGLEGSEVVVHALKPGRGCTKQDFEKFTLRVLELTEGKAIEGNEMEG